MQKAQKMVLILFGPPGSGKGTQGLLLADKLSLYYFETSKILEKEFKNPSGESIEIDGEKFSFLEEKKLWEKGYLCSPPFVSYLVGKSIRELAEGGENLLLAGSPRTIFEAEKIIPLLKEFYSPENIKVFLLEISAEQTIFRNTHRRICELMRHPILHSEENEKLSKCPLDGSLLLKREGLDDQESIKTRLKEYEERTLPVIEIFKKEGISVEKINGEQPPADVFKDILKSLK